MSKSIKKYFNLPMGSYCGLLLEKRLAIRVQKLLTKQTQELKELIAANIDETEEAHWTLAYPDGDQVSVDFYDPQASYEDKMDRLDLLDKSSRIKSLGEVYEAESMEDAERAYLKHHNKLEYLRDKNGEK